MKIRTLTTLFALLALFAVACGDSSTTSTVTGAAPTTEEPTTVVEDVDEEPEAADMAEDVEEEAEEEPADVMSDGSVPTSIISLNPTATEMLFAIGAGDQVVAVDAFSYYPEEAPVTDIVGWDPNIEALAGFEPDLVITDSPLEALAAIDVENHVVPAATSLDDIYTQIEELGVKTGHVAEAAELVGQMQTDIAAVLAALPDRDEPLTYYHELDDTLFSVTSDTFIGYVYDLLGLTNVADAADPDGVAFGYPQLNEEFIVDADPDIIFLADTLCCGQNAATVAERPGWAELSAVQAGNVIELNDDIVSRWGPRIVEFIETAGTAVADL